MKLLAGELTALAGTRTEARDLRIGYFAQHQLEQLAPQDSPLQNLQAPGRGARRTRHRAGAARFPGRLWLSRAIGCSSRSAPFSGGEKARLMLALVTYRRPNLLLLDEPTNHLDLEMRQALAVALQDYAGAVVVVSHDRHLLRTVADQFYVVHAGARRRPLTAISRTMRNGWPMRTALRQAPASANLRRPSRAGSANARKRNAATA